MKGRPLKRDVFVRYFGGLGNQLFQYNFAKYLNLELGVQTKMLRSRQPSRVDREFDLDVFLRFTDEEPAFPRWSLAQARGLISKTLSNRLDRIGFFNVSHETRPFVTPEGTFLKSGKPMAFSGYYQNFELVEKASGSYLASLEAFLAPISHNARSRIGISHEAPILHVRIGDLLHVSNRHMGLLSTEFYGAALDSFGLNPSSAVVLTDDPLNAGSIAKALGIKTIIGPEKTTPWETLAIFSTSEFLVTSNSTLSWWGGYLGTNQGNQVAMPSTWFKDQSVQPESSLHIPNATLIESSFD
jgi:hypothetical protein